MFDAERAMIGRGVQQILNLKVGIEQAQVKQVFVRGVRVAAVNTATALMSETANFYLEKHGLNSRRVAVLTVPNPDQNVSINPRRMKVM